MKTPNVRKGTGDLSSGMLCETGSALPLVLVILVVVSFLGYGLLTLGTATGIEASKEVVAAGAFWAGEAGIEHAKAVARENRRPFDELGLIGTSVLTGTLGENGKYTYSVDIGEDPGAIPGSRTKRFVVTSTGRARTGMGKTLQVFVETETFASYMHASHYEETADGTNIYFGPNDILDGPVYTNDELNIYGGARILGLTRSAAESVNYQYGATSDTFEGGLDLGVPPLQFSEQFGPNHIDKVAEAADNGGLALSGTYWLVFNSDGTVTYRRWTGRRWGAPETTALDTLNGAIYVDGDAYVEGTVDGQVSVASGDDMYLTGDLRYESAIDPSPFDGDFDPMNVDDTLGLVARDRVEIYDRYEIDVHAAILVTEGDDGFGARYRYSWIGEPAINLYGSVAQYRRGVVGRSNGQGFRKNYKYDTRFLSSPPPHYPFTSYRFYGWQEVL
ncbi:MAG: hypothetical protein K9N51_07820 [Candidatus Pacebacteria bacterium]|nr:hypothetical protein [Candidatus Paceibacterota bacterium]